MPGARSSNRALFGGTAEIDRRVPTLLPRDFDGAASLRTPGMTRPGPDRVIRRKQWPLARA